MIIVAPGMKTTTGVKVPSGAKQRIDEPCVSIGMQTGAPPFEPPVPPDVVPPVPPDVVPPVPPVAPPVASAPPVPAGVAPPVPVVGVESPLDELLHARTPDVANNNRASKREELDMVFSNTAARDRQACTTWLVLTSH